MNEIDTQPASRKKNKVISVAVCEADKSDLEKAARNRGWTISTFMRRAAIALAAKDKGEKIPPL